MLQCTYCKTKSNEANHPAQKHEPGCPCLGLESNGFRYPKDEGNAALYEKGWNDGRELKQPVAPDNQTYMLGYLHGESAAEEATNG